MSRYFATAAAGASYLIAEEFEGTGLPTGFTNYTAAPDYDYTAAPLKGSQSMLANQSTEGAYVDFTGQSELWVRMMFAIDSFSSTPSVVYLRDVSNNNLVYVRVLTTGKLRIYNGDGTQIGTGGTTLSTGTTYYLWVHYKKGTGSNAVVGIYVSSTSTRGSAEAASTSAKGAADCSRLLLNPAVASTAETYDNLLVSASEIGSGDLP